MIAVIIDNLIYTGNLVNTSYVAGFDISYVVVAESLWGRVLSIQQESMYM